MSPTTVGQRHPLSPLQAEILLHALGAPGSGVHVHQLCGEVDLSLEQGLMEAWARALRRFPALRSRFVWEEAGEAFREVEVDSGFPWHEHDWRSLSVADAREGLEELLSAVRSEGFNPARGPLHRLDVVRLQGSLVLAWTYHQLLADDGTAVAMVASTLDEAAQLAAGRPLPPVVDGEDPALPSESAEAEAWWREHLSGVTGPTPVLRRPGRVGEASVASANRTLVLPRPVTEALRSVARHEGLPMEALVRCAWSILLARQAGEEEVLLGLLVPDRLLGSVGFRNPLPLRATVPGDQPALAWARALHERVQEASVHAAVSPARLRAWSGLPAGTPLTEALLVWRDAPADASLPEGTGHGFTLLTRWGWPLVLEAEGGTDLTLRMAFDPARLDDQDARRLLERLGALLEGIAREPGVRIGGLPSLAGEEAEALRSWNGTGTRYRELDFVHRIVSARAAGLPDALAVDDGGIQVTLSELEHRANRVARALLELGVVPGDRIGLAVPRTADVAVGILGILRAGAAWVPVDPGYPRDRIALILEDAGIRGLLARESVVAALPEVDAPVLLLDEVEGRIDLEGSDPEVEVSPRHPAYLVYTSGSTGRPKGVVIGHGNLAHYVQAMRGALGILPGDRYLHTASIGFSSSVRQLFLPLASGGALVMASAAEVADPGLLFQRVRSSGATVLDLVPSYWGQCISFLEQLPPEQRAPLLENRIRLVVSASEPLPADLPHRWRSGLGHPARMVNMFGQTETTGIATTYPVEDPSRVAAQGGVVPIGRPIANTTVLVVGVHGQQAPPGVVGEVWVGGAGVGLGYWQLEEQTRQRFVTGFQGREGDRRFYRTGDLGRWREDGVLEFLGRGDLQVKIRGFRVELQEVEAALRGHPAVKEVVVIARPGHDGGQRLLAYVVTPATAASTSRDLRAFVRETLPEYMVPSAVVFMERLPRTPNGKVDRAALPEPEQDPADSALPESGSPGTAAEARLAGIFREVLGLERIGLKESFFELGGHSLLAIRAVARIREAFGVELPMRVLFDEPTVVGLAARLEEMEATGEPEPRIPRTEPTASSRPSSAQERLWVIQRLDAAATAYNLAAALRLRGPLDARALERALTEIVRRHETLRSRFQEVEGEPSIVVDPPSDFPLPVEEVQDEARLVPRAEEEVRRPFDLAAGPLFRGLLLRAGGEDHLLVLSMHHTVSDGWSRGVLYREIMALYQSLVAGRAPSLPELPIRYADYAAWQRDWLERHATVVEAQLDYWLGTLAGPLPVLELPTDHPRPPVQSFSGRTRTFRVPGALRHGLEALCREEDATVFMGLLAVFQSLLARYSGQEDIVVGTPTAGRTRPETEDLIGFFVNTLAIRTDLSGSPDFRSLLRRVREGALGAFANQDVPFDRVVDALRLGRDPSRSPLFQVLFILQNTPFPHLHLPGLDFDPVDVDPGAAKFDLTLSMIAESDGFKGQFEYNTDLFDEDSIDRMVGHLLTLLEGVVASPDVAVGLLPILEEAERDRMLLQWNDTSREVGEPATLHGMVEAQVDRTPDREAVLYEDDVLTYRVLDRRANRLAHHLRDLGVGPEVRVAVCMNRSAELMVALLGILKAGGAYVPVDPTYPADRVRLMLEDCGAPVVITEGGLLKDLPDLPGHVIRMDAHRATIARHPDTRPEGGAGPENLAYVIYTSGSTGRPKGVMVEHRNVANFFAGMDDRIGAGDPGTWLAVTSISFDISVLELFWTLSRGFRVVVHGDEREATLPPHLHRKMDFSLFYFAADAGEHEGNRYRLLLDGARFADEHGLAAIWTPERHFHAFGGLYPNPAVTGAAVAAITKNVRVRAGSVVLPLHDPIRVAEEWSMVDNLSGGRAELSVASGWHDRDFVFQPQNYADRRDLLMEQIGTLRALWRGEKIRRPAPKGEVEVGILPRPIQPELNIWLTAGGTPDTFVRAGESGCYLLTHLLGQSPEELVEKVALYRNAWKAAGHPGEGYVTLMIHTFIGPDLETVREKVWGPFREYLRTSVGLIRDLAEGRGQDMRSASFTEADLEALLDHAFDRYFQTSALMGTMDGCLEMVDGLKAIGVDECACLIDFGVSHADTMASLEHLPELMRRANPSAEELAARPRATPFPEQIRRHGVTHLQCTPSMARMLVADPASREALGDLRLIMLGGEPLPGSLRDELREVTGARLMNMYGPTETTIWSSTAPVGEGPISLGHPIANTRFYVVDRLMQPVSVGVAGELLIGGAGVVRGYLERPELTAERFLPDPFREDGGRVYRTGDRVRFLRDGTVDFMGRLDHQVKVRGHRIELGEIEAALAAHTGVKEAVAVVREDTPGDVRLVAYVVPAGDEVPETELRAWLRDTLPEYMIPSSVVSLEAFPSPRTGRSTVGTCRHPSGGLPRHVSDSHPPPKAWRRRLPVCGRRCWGWIEWVATTTSSTWVDTRS
jgi:natural product biosynthesis luciferase-like monooxygenase protein/amino acid adenylation domain-containing protein